MLNIKLKTSNTYYELGLSSLLEKLLNDNVRQSMCAFKIVVGNDCRQPNVIFRDFIVSVNLYKKGRLETDCKNERFDNSTIHIPFLCHHEKQEDILNKIRKILMIATMSKCAFIKGEVYQSIGIKKYHQLSLTENNIMRLMGEGNDTSDISRILQRSERTVGTHCRNAIKKMGMENRLEFYKYASYIARHGNKSEVTLCL